MQQHAGQKAEREPLEGTHRLSTIEDNANLGRRYCLGITFIYVPVTTNVQRGIHIELAT